MDLIFVVAFIGIGAATVAAIHHFRRKQVARVAEELGLEFQPKVEMLGELQGFELLVNRGRNQKFVNCFGGEADNTQFKVFEYTYVTGFGRSTKYHSQTVGYIDLSHWELPEFHVQPKSVFSKVFGGPPVNTIEIDPAFSLNFYTSCLEPPKVRPFFTEDVKYAMTMQNCSVESCRGRLLVYRFGKTVAHAQLKQFLTNSLDIMMKLDAARTNPAPLPVLEMPVAPVDLPTIV